MWRQDLLKNKLFALLLFILGVFITAIAEDGTAMLFLSILSVLLFVSKHNWIN